MPGIHLPVGLALLRAGGVPPFTGFDTIRQLQGYFNPDDPAARPFR